MVWCCDEQLKNPVVFLHMAVAYGIEYSLYLSQPKLMAADVPHGCEASMLGSGSADIDMVVTGVGADQAGDDS